VTPDGCVVGVDVGGTSTRALVMSLDGTVLGRGAAGGANPNSHPPPLAAGRVAEAVAAAFGPRDLGSARHCVLGLAGVSKLSDPAVGREFDSALAGIGLRCPVTSVSDAEVAYASATGEPDGSVLVAGTGSIAVRIAARRRGTVAGGHGWLLGDEGSAFWIGREAVRATLHALRSQAGIGPLATAVLAEALPGELDTEPGWRERYYARLITAANAEPPIRLARFAALVSEYATADPAAKEIVGAAAATLIDLLHAVRAPAERTPLVLIGSVAGAGTPVGEALRAALTAQSEGPVLTAAEGAAGAAWLAALEVLGPDAPRPRY
jgi:N-acetylglucosamine kinase-like BadF-type ATPase